MWRARETEKLVKIGDLVKSRLGEAQMAFGRDKYNGRDEGG